MALDPLELPDVGAGNQTQAINKSSKCSQALSHLCSQDFLGFELSVVAIIHFCLPLFVFLGSAEQPGPGDASVMISRVLGYITQLPAL